jgi:hypothetical protein
MEVQRLQTFHPAYSLTLLWAVCNSLYRVIMLSQHSVLSRREIPPDSKVTTVSKTTESQMILASLTLLAADRDLPKTP